MVYLEIIATLHLISSFIILFVMCGVCLSQDYNPPPMDENAKRMYS